MGLFDSPIHQPFLWTNGLPAAVLIHGFPGSPAEIRPLAQSLHRAGWTVQGLLLPGFGAQFETLGERRYPDWVQAARQAVRWLRSSHAPVLLIGFSMGAAVATIASTGDDRPDGLVLLAPFSGGVGLLDAVFPVLRRTVPTIRPFRLFRLDFSNPDVRKGLANFAPGMDLGDPDVQRALAEIALPTASLDEVRRAGHAARAAAPGIRVPTMVLQGAQDRVVWPQATRSLMDRFTSPVRYREVAGAHDLLDSSQPAWLRVEHHVLEFARDLVLTTNSQRKTKQSEDL